MEFDIQIDEKMLKEIYGYSGIRKVMMGYLILISYLFLLFSILFIGDDSVLSPYLKIPFQWVFLILFLWIHMEFVIQYFRRKRSRLRILKKYKVTQFTQHILFKENDIELTNDVNEECYKVPYNQIIRVKRKKNLLLFLTKDYRLIVVDQSGIPFRGQNEVFRGVFEKMPQVKLSGKLR